MCIRDRGEDPVDDPEIYQKTSPMAYIKKARTPTLIQHGELDRRVPIANAYELRQGLENRGVKVEMVVYKGFGHGINKPKSMRAVMQLSLIHISEPTRLLSISYAVFCLKKKKKKKR